MKHITTPVEVRCDRPNIIVEQGEPISNAVCRVYAALKQRDDKAAAIEITLAINEYDKLVALHDELVVQRDALVKACEAQDEADRIRQEWECDEDDMAFEERLAKVFRAEEHSQKLRRAALALVSGEAE